MQQAARVSDQTAFMYMGEHWVRGHQLTLYYTSEKKTEDYITGRYG